MLAIRRVLLYSLYTRVAGQIVGPGLLGDIMSVEHLELVKPNGAAAGGEWPADATTYRFVRTKVRTYRLMLNDT
jgi:hypothetical protein